MKLTKEKKEKMLSEVYYDFVKMWAFGTDDDRRFITEWTYGFCQGDDKAAAEMMELLKSAAAGRRLWDDYPDTFESPEHAEWAYDLLTRYVEFPEEREKIAAQLHLTTQTLDAMAPDIVAECRIQAEEAAQ